MAIDFPSNPTNGQIYQNYYYDSSLPGWRNVGSKNGLSQRVATLETTASTYPSGLVPVIPTSVSVTGGSASVSASGVVSFTGTSQFYVNGIYTSGFDRYLVMIDMQNQSVANYVYMRHSTGGTWYTGTQAYFGIAYRQAATVANLSYGDNVSHHTIGWANPSNIASQFELEITNPYRNDLPTSTLIRSSYGTTSHTSVFGSGFVNVNDRFDGITIYNGSNTNMTGTLRAYGYRN